MNENMAGIRVRLLMKNTWLGLHTRLMAKDLHHNNWTLPGQNNKQMKMVPSYNLGACIVKHFLTWI